MRCVIIIETHAGPVTMLPTSSCDKFQTMLMLKVESLASRVLFVGLASNDDLQSTPHCDHHYINTSAHGYDRQFRHVFEKLLVPSHEWRRRVGRHVTITSQKQAHAHFILRSLEEITYLRSCVFFIYINTIKYVFRTNRIYDTNYCSQK